MSRVMRPLSAAERAEMGLRAASGHMYQQDKIWSRYSDDKVDIAGMLARVLRTLSKALPLDRPLTALSIGSSNEPLMPIDYAIGVGTFVPNNAVIIHEDAVALMARVMKERGIAHTTSECTLRGFTCSQVRVDPKVATPAEILRARKFATGHQVEGLTGGLEAK